MPGPNALRARGASTAVVTRLVPLVGGVAGLALAAWLVAQLGPGKVATLFARAGWLGVGAVVAFHLVQLVVSAAAWRAVAGPMTCRPTLLGYCRLRWLREAVNNLLPVAQIGGEFVAVRVLRRAGVALARAAAGTVADLTLEMLTQVAFTLLGLLLLLGTVDDRRIVGAATGLLVAAALVGIGFLGAQWLGLARVLEAGLVRVGGLLGWSGVAEVAGLHGALLSCYRAPRRVALASCGHMVSWLLGGVEVCLALHVLGRDVGLSAGLVIESLGQALKAAGFAVPGALGVQEGGLIVVCKAFDVPGELALALSLLKRLREVALGAPALVVWQLAAARTRSADAAGARP